MNKVILAKQQNTNLMERIGLTGHLNIYMMKMEIGLKKKNTITKKEC